MEKTYGNTTASHTRENVPDVKFWGEPNMWKLITKAWSEEEEWMKSTKALEIPGVGCLVQVSTQQDEMVAEAVVLVPGVKIKEKKDDDGNVISRSLIKMDW